MSLWTPSGEHPVDRNSEPAGAPPSSPSTPDSPDEGPALEDLPPEQRAQVEELTRQMQEAQTRMLRMPGAAVVAQEALQFYELAAVYLSQDPPRLDDAKLAIDALAGVAERLGGRLDQAEQPLRQALNQIQLAYVELSNRTEASSGTRD